MAVRTMALMLLGLLVLHSHVEPAPAQHSDIDKRNNELVTKQFKSVVLEGQLPQLFSKLALDHDIPIGLELDRSPEASNYRLEMANGTLPELLDQFVRQNGKYTWFIENGVLNISPRGEDRDRFLADILAVQIKHFSIKKGTSSAAVQQILCTSPEIKALMDANGLEAAGLDLTGFYIPQLGREFSIETSNATTKEILNRIVRDSPVARIWILSREDPARTFRVTVNSRQEPESPKY